jgi:hypothetical protein
MAQNPKSGKAKAKTGGSDPKADPTKGINTFFKSSVTQPASV